MWTNVTVYLSILNSGEAKIMQTKEKVSSKTKLNQGNDVLFCPCDKRRCCSDPENTFTGGRPGFHVTFLLIPLSGNGSFQYKYE